MPNRFQATVALPVVMVIDDQTANVQVVGQLLTQSDYDVVPVLDGREALALAERSPPDLVLPRGNPSAASLPNRTSVARCWRRRKRPCRRACRATK